VISQRAHAEKVQGHRSFGRRFKSNSLALYMQQYLAKNPDGYCPDHSCGVAFKSAELQVGEKA